MSNIDTSKWPDGRDPNLVFATHFKEVFTSSLCEVPYTSEAAKDRIFHEFEKIKTPEVVERMVNSHEKKQKEDLLRNVDILPEERMMRLREKDWVDLPNIAYKLEVYDWKLPREILALVHRDDRIHRVHGYGLKYSYILGENRIYVKELVGEQDLSEFGKEVWEGAKNQYRMAMLAMESK